MVPLPIMAATFMLAMARYTPLLVLPGMTPLGWAPLVVRTVLLIALAWLTLIWLPEDGYWSPTKSMTMLLFAGVSELAIGAVFGLAFMLPTAGLHTGGWLIDLQAGLGAATLLNPSGDSASESLLGQVLLLGATVLFFTLNLHLQFFKVLVASTEVLPLGGAGIRANPAVFLQMLGTPFALGLVIVAPILIVLFCLDVAIAFASRSMPQANVYFIALPLKVAVAFALMAVTLRQLPAWIDTLYRGAISQLPKLLGAH